MKINYQRLPVKAHYFFFMAAMGPILPFLPVYGKQMGVSAIVMGLVTSFLPILFLIAKPAFGYLIDRFRSLRKTLFVLLLAVTSGSYVSMYFLPQSPSAASQLSQLYFNNVSCQWLLNCQSLNSSSVEKCSKEKETLCHWSCEDATINYTSKVLFEVDERENHLLRAKCFFNHQTNNTRECFADKKCDIRCDSLEDDNCLYTSVSFIGFILLMSLGNIGFNVANSMSDAICFDVLGESCEMKYGKQRVWGTVGFGLAALIAGYTIDLWSRNGVFKDYTPTFLLVFAFTCIDLLCCKKLKLPSIMGSKSIAKDVYKLLKLKPIVIFLIFATIAGILDSLLIYFLFWYLEDVAFQTGYMADVKLIEGLIVAAETLGGETIFFSFSGKIIKKLGYGYTFVFCFVCYALRLFLISLASSPWWILPIELFMQGPTYALCYTNIVAYASVVAPSGTSATVQGIVAGMDDGFGFAVGSLIGGIMYKNLGGADTFRLFASLATVTSIAYLITHVTYLRHQVLDVDDGNKATWKSPEEAQKTCDTMES
ncbi:major facilitator superfamily domain-containing protein 6 isoform X2 [Prorops nasuta]|uniref:major facilitator superfamily domain-containing protein 6 isoform X2 n=1 Tax=Prorops nasuta TaxID=863751 RepID=UPI0034CE89C9